MSQRYISALIKCNGFIEYGENVYSVTNKKYVFLLCKCRIVKVATIYMYMYAHATPFPMMEI